jgi:hypothetical protein
VKGLVGLRFHQVPKGMHLQLERWLDARIEEDFPGTKDRLASTSAPASERTGFQPPPDREN